MAKKKPVTPDASEPPDIAVRYKFWAEKWDPEYARNALLHYVAQKGLADDCEKWFDRLYPDDRES